MTSTAIKPIDEFRHSVDNMGPQFLAALPKHVDVAKFQRTVVTAVSLTPKLLEMDRRSLFASAMRAASDGLLPDGREAALVPYKDQVQYIPMVGGLLKRMRQSGDVRSITCEIIYENDKFERWIDEVGEHVRHEPNYRGDRGAMIAAYAVVYTNNDGVYVEVMTRTEIEKARAVSKTKDLDSGPWKNWEAAMWRKTVLRKIAKTAPVATDVLEMIARDDAENNDLHQATTATVSTIKPSRPTRLQAIADGTTGLDTAITEDAPPAAPHEPTEGAGDGVF